VVPKNSFPQLFSFTRKPKCFIRFFLEKETNAVFSLPLSLRLQLSCWNYNPWYKKELGTRTVKTNGTIWLKVLDHEAREKLMNISVVL
jgi:hypothetical protein